MLNVLENVTCGFGSNTLTFDALLPNLVSSVVTLIKIFIPIALVVLGMLDLGKAVIGNDEKAMKENQGKLIKRVVYAVLVFLIVTIVQFVVGFLSSSGADDTDAAQSCINCFVNGSDECAVTVNTGSE